MFWDVFRRQDFELLLDAGLRVLSVHLPATFRSLILSGNWRAPEGMLQERQALHVAKRLIAGESFFGSTVPKPL
jgi:hypothetical protein